MRYNLGVDVGCTFADLLMFDVPGAPLGKKMPKFLKAAGSTPSAHQFLSPSRGTTNGSSCVRSAMVLFSSANGGEPSARVRKFLVHRNGCDAVRFSKCQSDPAEAGDQQATDARTSKMGVARPAGLPAFNCESHIESLRDRCLEENGLPAPKASLWV
jgi:hypothetical protein